MATYKVIQDIEAEDKLLGPLTLRQFIYAIIVFVSGFIAFKLAFVAWWLVIPFLPHMILFSVLAAPFGHDQSSEVWLLAKIRFMLKPRRRVWDQSGVKELVTITAPKTIERSRTNNLSQSEVRSRLQALANTIDSRGWAIKNVNVNMFTAPTYTQVPTSDRLLDASMLPQEVPAFDVQAVDDMLDERNNPTAQHLSQMIAASDQAHKDELRKMMQQGGQPTQQAGQAADYWFLDGNNGQPPAAPQGYATFDHNPLVMPGVPLAAPVAPKGPTSADEAALLEQIHADKARKHEQITSHMKVVQPLSQQHERVVQPLDEGSSTTLPATPPTPEPVQPAAALPPLPPQPAPAAPAQANPPMTPSPDPAILVLANNDDLNIATIARQANKVAQQQLPEDEVVISLH